MNKISLISEEKIDDIVISQADNDTEWEEPIHVRKTSLLPQRNLQNSKKNVKPLETYSFFL